MPPIEYKLYEVKFINQEKGNVAINYVLAENMGHIESEYADIESCKPLTPLEDLTK
jgi:hypothetical protein